jgi:hypothetical protein
MTVAKRWAFNLGLFYALALAVGLAAGLLVALGAGGFNDSIGATLDGGAPPTPAAPEALIVFPATLMYLGTLFVLPLVVFCLLFAEMLGWLKVERPTLRIIGLCPAAGLGPAGAVRPAASSAPSRHRRAPALSAAGRMATCASPTSAGRRF